MSIKQNSMKIKAGNTAMKNAITVAAFSFGRERRVA
jgi:hypothetical protein